MEGEEEGPLAGEDEVDLMVGVNRTVGAEEGEAMIGGDRGMIETANGTIETGDQYPSKKDRK